MDLVCVTGTDLFPIEIKAGMTITRDYFKGLNHMVKNFPENIPHDCGLVYAGEKKQQRTGVSIVPVHMLNQLFDTCGG